MALARVMHQLARPLSLDLGTAANLIGLIDRKVVRFSNLLVQQLSLQRFVLGND